MTDSRSSARAGSSPRRTSPSSPAACRRASAPRASPAGSSRAARRTSGLVVSDAPEHDQRRPLHPLRARSRRRCCCAASAAAWTRSARSSSTPATPTPPPAARGLEDAARMQGAAAIAAGVGSEAQVAVASTGVIGVPLEMNSVTQRDRQRRPRAARRRRRRLRRGDPHHRRVRQARLPGRRAVGRDRAADRPGQGRGDDLAGVRDAAVLRPDRRGAVAGDLRPAAGGDRQALVRADQRRRPAVDQRHRDPPVQRRVRRRGRARDRRRAALRRGAGRGLRQLALSIVRDGEGARRVGRVVVRGGDERRGRARWPARSPTRRWSRPRCTAAIPTGAGSSRRSGWRCPGPRRCRWTSRSRASRCARTGHSCPTTTTRCRRRSARDEVEYEIGLPGEGAETERFFSDLGHEYVTINAEYTT